MDAPPAAAAPDRPAYTLDPLAARVLAVLAEPCPDPADRVAPQVRRERDRLTWARPPIDMAPVPGAWRPESPAAGLELLVVEGLLPADWLAGAGAPRRVVRPCECDWYRDALARASHKMGCPAVVARARAASAPSSFYQLVAAATRIGAILAAESLARELWARCAPWRHPDATSPPPVLWRLEAGARQPVTLPPAGPLAHVAAELTTRAPEALRAAAYEANRTPGPANATRYAYTDTPPAVTRTFADARADAAALTIRLRACRGVWRQLAHAGAKLGTDHYGGAAFDGLRMAKVPNPFEPAVALCELEGGLFYPAGDGIVACALPDVLAW